MSLHPFQQVILANLASEGVVATLWPVKDTPAHREFNRLLAHYPAGSTVRIQDPTLRPLRKAEMGTVEAVQLNPSGPFLKITLKDGSTLDTLAENVTLVRLPAAHVILDELQPSNPSLL